MEEIKFIGLPIKVTTKQTDKNDNWEECQKKFDEAEDLGINPKNYCPECYEAQKEEEYDEKDLKNSVEYVRVADIIKYRPDTEDTTIVYVYDIESFFVYKVFMKTEDFCDKLKNLGVILG